MARKTARQRKEESKRQREYRETHPEQYEKWKRMSYIRYLEKHGYTVLAPEGVDRGIWDSIAGIEIDVFARSGLGVCGPNDIQT